MVNRKPESRWTGSNSINLSNLCTFRPKALFPWGPWSDVIRSEPLFVLRSPNFYWLCKDLLSVANRRFGISLILMDVSQFNLNANCRNVPFHAIFMTGSDDLATGSDDLLGSLGFLWWLKSFLQYGRRAQMLFRFLRTLLGPLLHLWPVSQYLLSLFHFLELVFNLNRVIKVKDHPQKVQTGLQFLYSSDDPFEILNWASIMGSYEEFHVAVTDKDRKFYYAPFFWNPNDLWKFHFFLHIEAETKWPPFFRHFQMDFLEWKCMNFD